VAKKQLFKVLELIVFFCYTEYMKNKGYIHIYTGNGKGKTTAALGLALRAAGWGKRTYIAQFMKKTQYGELLSIEKHLKDFITIEQFGVPGFHHTGDKVSEEEKNAAMQGIEAVKKAIASEKYHIIILDEANILAYFKIIDIRYLLDIMDNKPENLELILTGRNAPQEFIDRADLVTEMKEIKHYFTKNVTARVGVEK
jgi:cob(I)alamin adenosyltransferase